MNENWKVAYLRSNKWVMTDRHYFKIMSHAIHRQVLCWIHSILWFLQVLYWYNFSYVEIPFYCCQYLHNIQHMWIILLKTYYQIFIRTIFLKIQEKIFSIHLFHPSATFPSRFYALMHWDWKQNYRDSSLYGYSRDK